MNEKAVNACAFPKESKRILRWEFETEFDFFFSLRLDTLGGPPSNNGTREELEYLVIVPSMRSRTSEQSVHCPPPSSPATTISTVNIVVWEKARGGRY